MKKNFRVITRGVENAARLRRYAETRISRALGRFESHVHSVTMRLEDETGPGKGGVDKVCRLDVRLRSGEVRITEQADRFETAINAGCNRLKATLGREVGRAKTNVRVA